jgi:hypothetical protein
VLLFSAGKGRAVAGDWIKMRTALAAERATMVICELTGLDEFAVVGRLHAIWVWAGEHTVTGEVTGVTLKTIDRVTRFEKFGEAMKAAGWLETMPEGGLKFPRWKRHNSKASKERALAAVRQARKRRRERDGKRDKSVTPTVTNHAPRREETRGDERREENSNRDRTDRGAGPSQNLSPPLGRSRVNFSGREGEEPFDLSGVDWGLVVSLAEDVAKRVPPRTEDDRRAWLRYAVMAAQMFCDDWLIGSAEIVRNAKHTKQTRQAHFVAVLKSRAAEAIDGTDAETFNAIARRIEIPVEIWQSKVLEIR